MEQGSSETNVVHLPWTTTSLDSPCEVSKGIEHRGECLSDAVEILFDYGSLGGGRERRG